LADEKINVHAFSSDEFYLSCTRVVLKSVFKVYSMPQIIRKYVLMMWSIVVY